MVSAKFHFPQEKSWSQEVDTAIHISHKLSPMLCFDCIAGTGRAHIVISDCSSKEAMSITLLGIILLQ